MPDRPAVLIRTPRSYLGGALILYGLCYALLGAIWLTTDVHGWREGLAWTRGMITEGFIGWSWLAAGFFAVVAGSLAPVAKVLESIAFAVVVLVPAALAVWFVIAYLLVGADDALRWACMWLILATWSGWTGARGDDQREEVVVT